VKESRKERSRNGSYADAAFFYGKKAWWREGETERVTVSSNLDYKEEGCE
jgi:hypothetical protein